MKNTHKIAYLSIFSALAIIFGYVETLFPVFIGIPGIKLGLANLAVLFILHRYTWKDAAFVSVIRIIVIGFLFGNMFSILYSLAGAALSILVMTLIRRNTQFSTIGVSVAGGVFHNIGQILMAMLLLGTAELGYYLIVLTVTGTISGILIGLCGGMLVKRISPRIN